MGSDALVVRSDALIVCGDALINRSDGLIVCGDALTNRSDALVVCGDVLIVRRSYLIDRKCALRSRFRLGKKGQYGPYGSLTSVRGFLQAFKAS